ncbi:MAG TPA: hypothetical protein VK013_05040 [Myxococcaceae bacterium]|nr:hypothetical protein [Myxococcaceae bacterium]
MSRPPVKGHLRLVTRVEREEAEDPLERPRKDRGAQEEAPAVYGVALLRIALLIRQEDGPELEEAIAQVAARMELDPLALRTWMAGHTGLLGALTPGQRARLQHPMD